VRLVARQPLRLAEREKRARIPERSEQGSAARAQSFGASSLDPHLTPSRRHGGGCQKDSTINPWILSPEDNQKRSRTSTALKTPMADVVDHFEIKDDPLARGFP
jgi:hypothetical protein